MIDITDRGRQILEAAFPLWERAQQEVDALIGANDLARLYSTLDKLRDNVEKRPAQSHSE